MKNPLVYLKHIVKDPINTIAEADARKKEIMPLMYGSAGLLAIGIILQVVVELNFMAVFSFIGLIGVVLCCFLLSVVNSAKTQFDALTCDKCKTLAEIKSHDDFVKYVSYSIEKDEATFKSGQRPIASPTNGVHSHLEVSARASAVVAVNITCPNCGEVKHLKYNAAPFKCHVARKNISVRDFELVFSNMETSVAAVVNDYNDPAKKARIPYTYHSSKNPNFENRYKFKGANGTNAHPDYMGVHIDYHKDVEEMLEHYLILRELQGSLYNPAKAKNK